MDEPVSAVVTTKEEALALMDRTFETCDQSLFAPMVRAMTDAEDAVVFGIGTSPRTKWTSSAKPCTCCASAGSPPCGARWPSSPGRRRSEPPKRPDDRRSQNYHEDQELSP